MELNGGTPPSCVCVCVCVLEGGRENVWGLRGVGVVHIKHTWANKASMDCSLLVHEVLTELN